MCRRFNGFMRDLLSEKAKDIFRCKGILAVHVSDVRCSWCVQLLHEYMRGRQHSLLAEGARFTVAASSCHTQANSLKACLSWSKGARILLRAGVCYVSLLAVGLLHRGTLARSLCSRACMRPSAMGPLRRGGQRGSHASIRSCSLAEGWIARCAAAGGGG